MNFNLVTIFPEIIKLLEFGVIGKAIEKDLISINGLNPRNFSNFAQNRAQVSNRQLGVSRATRTQNNNPGD